MWRGYGTNLAVRQLESRDFQCDTFEDVDDDVTAQDLGIVGAHDWESARSEVCGFDLGFWGSNCERACTVYGRCCARGVVARVIFLGTSSSSWRNQPHQEQVGYALLSRNNGV